MTKPKAKTTNAKKTSPLTKKGKLAFVQPLSEDNTQLLTKFGSVPKTITSRPLEPATYALQKDVDSLDDSFRAELASVNEKITAVAKDAVNLGTVLSDWNKALDFKVNVAIWTFGTIVVVTGLANLWYWLS